MSSEAREQMPDSAAEPSSLVYRPASILERLDLDHLFPARQPLEVELGSGDGSFLVQYAQANRGHNFIGVERLLGRLRKLDRKGRRAGLRNLRAIRLEASYFVEFLLPPASVRTLHIYFPDPWPKRRHHLRRLVNPRFTELARLALEIGGAVFLRTDNAEYFKQMIDVFGSNPAFEPVETPLALSAMLTDFERQFHAEGIKTLSAAFRRGE